MRARGFKTPPFVVWRIESRPADQSHYRLVPHGVLASILVHTFCQWALISLFVGTHVKTILAGIGIPIGLFIVFFALAALCNVLTLRLLNARSMAPTEALLQRSTMNVRSAYYDRAFPVLLAPHKDRVTWNQDRIAGRRHAGQPLPAPSRGRRFVRGLRLTWQTTIHFLFRLPATWPSRLRDSHRLTDYLRRWTRVWRIYGRISRWRQRNEFVRQRRSNRARLQALKLRREDSMLHAFSAFAVLSCFVELVRRTEAPVKPIPASFVIAYFMPILFGFFLCAVGFVLYAARESLFVECVGLSSMPTVKLWNDNSDKFPLMIGIFVWFVHGIAYVVATLEQDFKSLFKDYFNQRPFPSSMTHFANDIIEAAPDLKAMAREQWLSQVITAGMIGLAGLYAAFLQSL